MSFAHVSGWVFGFLLTQLVLRILREKDKPAESPPRKASFSSLPGREKRDVRNGFARGGEALDEVGPDHSKCSDECCRTWRRSHPYRGRNPNDETIR